MRFIPAFLIGSLLAMSLTLPVTPACGQSLFTGGQLTQINYGLDGGGIHVVVAPPPTAFNNPTRLETSLVWSDTGRFSGIQGTVQASAAYGQLRARATSTAYGGGSARDAGVQSWVSTSFSDILLVTSATLPINTPVTLRFNQTVDGYLVRTRGPLLEETTEGGSAFARADLLVANAITGQNSGFQRYYRHTNEATEPPITDPAIILNARVGDRLAITGILDARAYVATGQIRDIFNTAAEYYNTARFFADPVTPGVTLFSSSGHNYASSAAAPEPGTLALIGVGVFTLATSIRRQRYGKR